MQSINITNHIQLIPKDRKMKKWVYLAMCSIIREEVYENRKALNKAYRDILLYWNSCVQTSPLLIFPSARTVESSLYSLIQKSCSEKRTEWCTSVMNVVPMYDATKIQTSLSELLRIDYSVNIEKNVTNYLTPYGRAERWVGWKHTSGSRPQWTSAPSYATSGCSMRNNVSWR